MTFLFVGPGADEIYSEQGDDILYLLDDGVRDDISCADGFDQVFYVGGIDPLDDYDASSRCESVTPLATPPVGWPY